MTRKQIAATAGIAVIAIAVLSGLRHTGRQTAPASLVSDPSPAVVSAPATVAQADTSAHPTRLSRIPEPVRSQGSPSPVLDAAGLPTDPGVRRQTYVRVDVPLSLLAEARADAGPLRGFSIPVFDGKELEIEITGQETHGSGSGSFVGQVAGKPGSFVILGYDGEAEAGTVQIPQEGYLLSITYAGDGILRISELDPSNIPTCAEPLAPGGPDHTHAL